MQKKLKQTQARSQNYEKLTHLFESIKIIIEEITKKYAVIISTSNFFFLNFTNPTKIAKDYTENILNLIETYRIIRLCKKLKDPVKFTNLRKLIIRN